ncbi:MAG: peptidoglycan DD-metalloendopeptidase family protein [Bdellovibrionaceae bacterium]|nr:peptidoglycan DD-metalloendopeptidase family protein [Pseudobdellovibrionaceae bacterium]
MLTPAVKAQEENSTFGDFSKTKEQVMEQERQKREILGALYSINKKIKSTSNEKGKIKANILRTKVEIQKLSDELSNFERQLKEQRARLATRLRFMYLSNRKGFFKSIFSFGSTLELERNLRILGAYAKKEKELIQGYKETMNAIQKKLKLREERLKQLSALRKEVENKERFLASEYGLRKKILDNVRKNSSIMYNKIIQMRSKISARVADTGVLDALFAPSFWELKGQLDSPVPDGKIVDFFGPISSKEGWIVNNKGVFFFAPEGRPVVSVASGKIAFLGNVGAFGNTLIIDHGDHHYTVYGHIQSPKVVVGQNVSDRQQIGLVGKNILDGRSGVYFEIRSFSEPEDPTDWLRRSL